MSEQESMRLGPIEFWAMNNPVRRWIQKHIEFHTFKKHLFKHGINLNGRTIMDAGCGSGYSTKLILNEFSPVKIIAFDLMPEQIRLARRRGLPVDFFTADLTRLDLPHSVCDAVFIFGILHHIPEWRTALQEVSRVLSPGGVFPCSEPQYRFTWPELEAGLHEAGMEILEKENLAGNLYRSYLCRKK